MDKNFMPVHTPQFRSIIEVIERSMGKACHADHGKSDILIYRNDFELCPIKIMISRAIDYTYIKLQTDIKIEIDHEVVLDTTIKSDHDIDRIMQIIRCLNTERLRNDDLPDLIDDTDYLLDERYEWITPDFSGIEECPFDFV